MSDPSHFVLTFLQSVATRQDAEYYLKLFRELPKASFAVIVVEAPVLAQAPASVIEPLRFLARLGLYPVLALGVLGPPGMLAEEVRAWLAEEGVAVSDVATSDTAWVTRVQDALTSERCVVSDLSAHGDASPFRLLEELLRGLGTRKLVILRSVGGLGTKEAGRLSLTQTHRLVTSENGISVINLKSDLAALEAKRALDASELHLLRELNELHAALPHLLTSVASPLNVLRELFTVKGAGTLIKTGASIDRFSSYTDLDVARLVRLLEETFERKLDDEFIMRPPLHVYLERNYRGAAVLQTGLCGAFLTKFAVTKRAQGEGIGRDLWEAMLRDHPEVYWRARASNPAVNWYRTECDGMQRSEDWYVFWKGIDAGEVPRIVRDALDRPRDFEEAAS